MRFFLFLLLVGCSGVHHQRGYIISQSPTEERTEEQWEEALEAPQEALEIEG